jgi:hypothetical protein
MINEAIENKAKMYVYDLNNCAQENGFKADETWEFSLATDVEKIALEKKYFPTITSKVLPELLTELYHTVKAKLTHAKYSGDRAGTHVPGSNLQYLVAYNPNRLRH